MWFIDKGGLDALLQELQRRGYELIGPTVRNGAIVLDRIDGVHDLPAGVGEAAEPGGYRLVERNDGRLFGFAHGPDSAKRFLFPPRERLATARQSGGRLTVEESPPPVDRYAFIGLRSCDLHAVAIQDRVFIGGRARDPRYAARREQAFFVGVDCAEPGGTCFCASTATGPGCTKGFDLALTELEGGFLVRAGTERGRDVLEAVAPRPATSDEESQAEQQPRDAAVAMGADVDLSGLPGLLYRNREHPRWAEVAQRCLTCGNCTAVCPTCFCHDVVDASDLLGVTATRTREWATCFSTEFSHVAGDEVRTSGAARYRQWLTHKFAGWIDQFGTSGCVGCGRCVTWCPVGIDVREELGAIRATDGAVADQEDELVGSRP